MLLPDTTSERQIVYITGRSGSGKSTFTRKYIEEFKKRNKKIQDVYLFSSLKEDESLDSIKPKRIKLETLVDDPSRN
jgi:uridine kinase